MNCQAIVIGGSAGGVEALHAVLSALPADFAPPVLVVQHLHPGDGGSFAQHLACATRLPVVEPCDKQPIEGGHVYAAPADYHMLVEKGGTISLSVDAKVNWSRPSVDVLFESAARAWGGALVAVLLSGANEDGARGMCAVKAAGGRTIAQDPRTAQVPVMPLAAIDAGAADEVLTAGEIGRRLQELGGRSSARTRRPATLDPRTERREGRRT